MSSESLDSNNFIDFCKNNCDKRLIQDEEELLEDLQSIKYIKKLVTRYKTTLELKERLILNHITLLNNLFGPEITTKILYFKIYDDFSLVKPFLLKMNLMPQFLYNVAGNQIVDLSSIPSNERVAAKIEEL